MFVKLEILKLPICDPPFFGDGICMIVPIFRPFHYLPWQLSLVPCAFAQPASTEAPRRTVLPYQTVNSDIGDIGNNK